MSPCPECSAPLSNDARFCPACGAPRSGTEAPTVAHSVGSGTSHASLDRARFLPGTVLGERYRMVGLLGRGGMGEVYRADDVKLGQSVALKFLPEQFERDGARLERLLNEVKLARQVAHPNVCRVYDVGEVDGRHFISMEYVDGENLASLLRQVGRLPQDRALQIARQLCAGLAAAHEQGILHRDLKPANVMIDGRGRARITDFGLASTAGEREEGQVAGTPEYMAPEQFDKGEVTTLSDLYSLGLVLFELFTGKGAFDTATTSRTARRPDDSTPTAPTSLVEGLDPGIERVILRCLERDPANRPPSALAIAAALPGGDPIAAALAAGETPSPEMIAAAGPGGGLSVGVASALLAFVLAGLAGFAVLHPKMTLYGRVSMSRSVPALTENARQIVRELGYTDPPVDAVSYLESDWGLQAYLEARDSSASRWDTLAESNQMLLRLFYRQGSRNFAPSVTGNVTFDDPPQDPGDVSVRVDLEGRLRFFLAIPPLTMYEGVAAASPDWSVLFAQAGLSMADFEPVQPSVFRTHADARAAWLGRVEAHGGIPTRIEAAAFQGKPIYFETILESSSLWSADSAEDGAAIKERWSTSFLVFSIVGLACIIAAVFFAVRNLRNGRGDRRGALRVAIVIFVLAMLDWILNDHHVAGSEEWGLLGIALSFASLSAVVIYGFYLALEPYVRRLWPGVLVSWSRLIAGRLRDPLVGRDVLIGLAFGVAGRLLYYTAYRAPEWFDLPAPFYDWFGLEAMRGGRFVVGGVVDVLFNILPFQLLTLLTLMLLRKLLRLQWLTLAVYGLYIAFEAGGSLLNAGDAPGLWPVAVAVGIAQAVLFLVLIFRFGLVALIASGMTELVKLFPVTADATAPYFGTSLLGLSLMAAIATYGFVVCRGATARA